jgi:hypothetical protein
MDKHAHGDTVLVMSRKMTGRTRTLGRRNKDDRKQNTLAPLGQTIPHFTLAHLLIAIYLKPYCTFFFLFYGRLVLRCARDDTGDVRPQSGGLWR